MLLTLSALGLSLLSSTVTSSYSTTFTFTSLLINLPLSTCSMMTRVQHLGKLLSQLAGPIIIGHQLLKQVKFGVVVRLVVATELVDLAEYLMFGHLLLRLLLICSTCKVLLCMHEGRGFWGKQDVAIVIVVVLEWMECHVLDRWGWRDRVDSLVPLKLRQFYKLSVWCLSGATLLSTGALLIDLYVHLARLPSILVTIPLSQVSIGQSIRCLLSIVHSLRLSRWAFRA